MAAIAAPVDALPYLAGVLAFQETHIGGIDVTIPIFVRQDIPVVVEGQTKFGGPPRVVGVIGVGGVAFRSHAEIEGQVYQA